MAVIFNFKSIFFSAPEIVEKNALQLVVAAEQASQEVTEEDDEEIVCVLEFPCQIVSVLCQLVTLMANYHVFFFTQR